MLILKESKNLISQPENVENKFTALLFKSEDSQQLLNIEMDLENNIVIFQTVINNEGFIFTFDPKQAAHLGTWLLEAGTILNFCQSVNLDLTSEESTDE